jgi:hypothetical protein
MVQTLQIHPTVNAAVDFTKHFVMSMTVASRMEIVKKFHYKKPVFDVRKVGAH